MMIIRGFQKTSLLDYSGKVSSIVFLGRCNFRCPFCQNPDLVNDVGPEIDKNEILSWLGSKRKWIDAVVISGGEPTVHNDLPEFIKKIKEMGFLVKLFTNGSNPEMLEFLINNKLIDAVSMDIKSSLENYEKVANVKISREDIQKSVNIIRNSNLDYSFHTTVIPDFFNEDIALEIGKWLKGSKKYYIQQFNNRITLNKEFQNKQPYSIEKLQELVKILKPFFEICEIRGV